jgi:hypothetical protein
MLISINSLKIYIIFIKNNDQNVGFYQIYFVWRNQETYLYLDLIQIRILSLFRFNPNKNTIFI